MTIILSLVLVIIGMLWLLVSRPQPEWRGEAAAQFAASLILIPAAIIALVNALGLQSPSWQQANMVLQELAMYAALPLLSVVLISQAARLWGSPYDWERMIWGRILLGVCVVYEMCRRSQVLPEMLLTFAGLVSLVMLAALVLHIRRQQIAPVEIFSTIAMSGLSLAMFTQMEMGPLVVLALFSGLLWLWHLQQSLLLRRQQNE